MKLLGFLVLSLTLVIYISESLGSAIDNEEKCITVHHIIDAPQGKKCPEGTVEVWPGKCRVRLYKCPRSSDELNE